MPCLYKANFVYFLNLLKQYTLGRVKHTDAKKHIAFVIFVGIKGIEKLVIERKEGRKEEKDVRNVIFRLEMLFEGLDSGKS